MTTKKTDKGHEAEAFGYRVATEERDGAWSVLITQKPRELGARTVIVAEVDGFPHEGPALDHGMDWALEHRPYIVDVKPSGGRGFIGMVLNEHGYDEYRTAECGNGDEAQALCDAYVFARRQHDLKIIAERRQFRANARVIEDDFHALERTRVLTMRGRGQTDLEAHPAVRGSNKGTRAPQGTAQV